MSNCKTNYADTEAIIKKIETCKRNILTEKAAVMPNYKLLSRLTKELGILEAELDSCHGYQDGLIIQKAKQCVYTALKTIFARTGDKQIGDIMNSVKARISDTDTMPLAQELINIAALTIIEVWKKATCRSFNSFLELDFYNFEYKEYRNKAGELTYHTPFTYTLSQINKFIHSQKNNKGRKVITKYDTITIAPCITYDNEGNVKHVEYFDTVKIPTCRGYAIELHPLSVAIEKPENAHHFSAENDMLQEAEYKEHLKIMRNALTPNERIVFDLLQQGYSQVEIADKLEKHPGTIRVLVSRIRQKIASLQSRGVYIYDYNALEKFRK